LEELMKKNLFLMKTLPERMPPGTDDVPEDDDKAVEEAVDEPYTEPGDELTMQHDNRVYVSPIGVAASEDHDVMRIDYEPDKSTESGELREEPIEGVDDAKTHDGELTPEPTSSSTPMSQDHYSSLR
jgi:hypothetical protein